MVFLWREQKLFLIDHVFEEISFNHLIGSFIPLKTKHFLFVMGKSWWFCWDWCLAKDGGEKQIEKQDDIIQIHRVLSPYSEFSVCEMGMHTSFMSDNCHVKLNGKLITGPKLHTLNKENQRFCHPLTARNVHMVSLIFEHLHPLVQSTYQEAVKCQNYHPLPTHICPFTWTHLQKQLF